MHLSAAPQRAVTALGCSGWGPRQPHCPFSTATLLKTPLASDFG